MHMLCSFGAGALKLRVNRLGPRSRPQTPRQTVSQMAQGRIADNVFHFARQVVTFQKADVYSLK